jgi:hypothetical protein
MAKKDSVAEAIAKLATLRTSDSPRELANGLTAALKERSSYVVAGAASLAAERNVREAIPAIVARLARLFDDAKSDDIGCTAALAMVRALVTLEAGYEAEEVALRALRHARWEPVYGGSVDVAVSTRGNAAILLAAMGSREALRCATELLAEADQRPPRERASWAARADAARALTMIGSDGAAAVLRFKLLIGDAEPTVLADCLTGLLTIERDAALPLATQMLTTADERHNEAALLALGSWRDPRAFAVLHAHADRFLVSASRDLFLASVAMTRQPAAVDYLLELVRSKSPKLRDAAMEAIEAIRILPGIAERLAEAIRAK